MEVVAWQSLMQTIGFGLSEITWAIFKKNSVQKDSPFLHTVILSSSSDRAVSVSDILFKDISICDTLSSLAVSVSLIIDSYQYCRMAFKYAIIFNVFVPKTGL